MISCYLFAVVQQHDVIISQVVLTEVWALLRHREITLLIGTSEGRRGRGRNKEWTWERGRTETDRRVAKKEWVWITYSFIILQTLPLNYNNGHSPEEASVFHIICIFIVLFLRTNPHPEEVLWLLPLINDLGDKIINQFDVIHFSCKILNWATFKKNRDVEQKLKWSML